MSSLRYITKSFDDILILSTLAKIAYANDTVVNEDELYVLESLKRANPKLNDYNIEEISTYLQTLNEAQLLGLSNNVKGILHEMQFVEIENNNGDHITAALFEESYHRDYDILLTNNITGEYTEIQLKASDSSSYVNDWISNHQEGEILITEELADKMNLPSSGFSNAELTTNVDNFINKIIVLDENDELWDYIPSLPAISIAISSFHLFKLYRENKINYQTLQSKFILLSGAKLAKFTLIAGLMLIPVINVIVGASILFNLLYGAGTIVYKIAK